MTLDPKREQFLLAKIQRLERGVALKRGLPHIYAFPWYKWARRFKESTAKIYLLCAANQISKSSTQIRTCIDWATNKEEWKRLWVHIPNQFWYLYPTSTQVNIEFETKWKLFLPKGEYKEDPIYGWHEERKEGNVVAIKFNSGVNIYFKTYAQNVAALQSGTCDALFCDEELPEVLYHELIFRISATDGYFRMVFTATLGQDFWRRAMEVESLGEDEEEVLPEATKECISLYDCKEYEDGSPSPWTEEKINVTINRCATHNEVLKRVYGRFVMDKGGLKYPTFDIKRHMKPHHIIPKGWTIYGCADSGSGGEFAHPAAISFLAVRPDNKQGRVFLGWRGDGIQTTSGDVVAKFLDMKKSNGLTNVVQSYDWSDADFKIISDGLGETFEKAEKGHETGENLLNTLFKNDMLAIYETDELRKLSKEFTTLRNKTKKRHANDNLIDTVRYNVSKVSWDFSDISSELKEDSPEVSKKPLTDLEAQIVERRKAFDENSYENEAVEQEFAEANESYGS